MGRLTAAKVKNIGDETHGRPGRENIGSASNIFLEDVILHRAPQLIHGHTLSFAHRNHHRQQNGRWRIDRHADGDFIQGDAIQQQGHIIQAGNADAHFTHLTQRHGIIRIVANLGGQIKSDRKARLSLVEQEFIALVRLRRRTKPGILTHGPVTAAIHRRLDASGKRIFTGKTELLVIISYFRRRVQAIYGNA